MKFFARSSRTRGLCLLFAALITITDVPAAPFDAEADFMYATGLFRKKRWQYAADAFDDFLKSHPGHERVSLARLYLGLSLNSLEKYQPAREQFVTFARENPDSRNIADARYRIGECSFYLKEYPQAIAQLSEYLQKHQGHNLNEWATLMLGESHNALSDWEKAETVLRPMLEAGPNARILPDTMFALAVSLQGRQQTVSALELFQQVVDQKSDAFSHRALARIGTIHFDAGRFAEASAVWDDLVKNYGDKPTAASAALQSGIAQFQLGRFQEALLRLDGVPADAEVSAVAGMWKGLCRRELGQLDDARQVLVQAFAEAGDTPLAAEILFTSAQIEVLDKHPEVAAQMFLDLVDRWPQDRRVVESLFNAAELKMEIGDFPAARRLLDRLQTDQPDVAQRPNIMLLNGRLLLHEDKTAEAIEWLRKAVSSEDGTRREKLLRQYHLIRALHRGGRFEEVLTIFEPLREEFTGPMADSFFGALALASMSSLELKQYDRARQYADEFLKVETDPARVADAVAVRAVASAWLKQFDTTRTDLNRLITDSAQNSQTWVAVLQSAEAAWQQQEYAVAAELFGLAIERRSDPKLCLSALSGAAWSHYRLGQFAEAAELFRRAHSEYPDSPAAAESAFMEATCHFEAGQREQAAAMFLTLYDLLEKKPSESQDAASESWLLDAGRMHARILVENGQVDAADKMWDRVATRFDQSEKLDEILDEWAYVNLQNGRYARSDEVYRRLLDRFPESRFAGQARLSLAESEMQANRLDTALPEFLAIAQDGRYGASEREAALFHAIDIFAAQRDWQSVIRHAGLFADRYSGSPHAPNVQLLYAEALLDKQKLPEARASLASLRQAVLDERLAPEPWTDRIWVALAEVALAEKRYDDVDTIAAELEQQNPRSRFLFQIRDVQGRRWKTQAEPDFARARQYFTQVTQDEVGRGTETAARCQFLIAETLLLEGSLEAALKEYYRVYLSYAYDDWRARGLYQAAGCERQLNQPQAAIRSYEDLIRDFPTSEFAAKAREKLQELNTTPN
ncbi:MAG: tetratricopeptide repeat protein [Fuerstiella sp.]